MIKNIEDLKKIQIVCKNQNQVKDCVRYLKELGYIFADRYGNETDIIIFFGDTGKEIFLTYQIYKNLYVEFYNKELVKNLQKFIKEKEEKEMNNLNPKRPMMFTHQLDPETQRLQDKLIEKQKEYEKTKDYERYNTYLNGAVISITVGYYIYAAILSYFVAEYHLLHIKDTANLVGFCVINFMFILSVSVILFNTLKKFATDLENKILKKYER